jgi:hypothetical protein
MRLLVCGGRNYDGERSRHLLRKVLVKRSPDPVRHTFGQKAEISLKKCANSQLQK